MGNVDFMENQESVYQSRRVIGAPTTPPVFGFLIKTGLVKSSKQAYYLLISLALVCFALSIFVYVNVTSRPGNRSPDYDRVNGYTAEQKKQIPPEMVDTYFPNAK
jgi:hypothetical protein